MCNIDELINELINALNDGRSNVKKAYELERELGMGGGRTNEPTRDLVRNAIVNHYIPIGSGRTGYFLINDESELNAVIEGIQNRIDGLQNRIDGLKIGWQKRLESRENGENWPKGG